jgi:hypothetical protein
MRRPAWGLAAAQFPPPNLRLLITEGGLYNAAVLGNPLSIPPL